MVNSEKLIQIIKENKRTQSEVADMLGITYATFYRKLLKRELLSSEIEVILQNLKFSVDPMEVFFEGIKPKVIREYEKEEWYQ